MSQVASRKSIPRAENLVLPLPIDLYRKTKPALIYNLELYIYFVHWIIISYVLSISTKKVVSNARQNLPVIIPGRSSKFKIDPTRSVGFRSEKF